VLAVAEQAGDALPHGMQRLLADAVWDTDAVRDDLRGYVAEGLGEPDGVLILDDTADLKRGAHTVGVQRQYTGMAGKIENAQVAVFLGYASGKGRALVDRDVYLPRAWTDNPNRMAAAGVPDEVGFASKVTLGRRMLARAFDAGVPAAWVTADEFYGGDRGLRRDLQGRDVGYVLAVVKSHRVDLPIGRLRADQAAARLHPTLLEPALRRQRRQRRTRLRLGATAYHPTRRRERRPSPVARTPPHRRR
jgi:SRSO17 transposase